MKRFYIHKLGCPKNDVDADYIAGFLLAHGLTPAESPETADLLIANTCAFIHDAREESVEAILQLARLKGNSRCKLVITGCLSQRYTAELAAEIPEADGIIGIGNIDMLAEIIDDNATRIVARNEPSRRYMEYQYPRYIEPQYPFDYVQISDGCNNRCAYCAIPDIRGPYRSRTIESIIAEIQQLIDAGKREVILVSQDTTNYGADIYGTPSLLTLLTRLEPIAGSIWFRLLYLHPARLNGDLLDYIIDNDRICSYFDIPLQHISDRMLAMMNRKVSRRQIEGILGHIRGHKKAAAIRTSFITGFPGERREDFDELLAFVEAFEFDRLGVFAYSPEESTPAAGLADQISEDDAILRRDELMLRQQAIAFDRNDAAVGSDMEVIVDSIEDDVAVCRSRFDAPDIDQTIVLSAATLKPGDIVRARITASDGYDLRGERVVG